MKARPKGKIALVYSSGAGRAVQPVLDSYALARALRGLADRAECGELLGAAVAVWTEAEGVEMRVAGLLERDIIKAHYAASRLVDALLYYDRDERG